jgi:hypothetical protein
VVAQLRQIVPDAMEGDRGEMGCLGRCMLAPTRPMEVSSTACENRTSSSCADTLWALLRKMAHSGDLASAVSLHSVGVPAH